MQAEWERFLPETFISKILKNGVYINPYSTNDIDMANATYDKKAKVLKALLFFSNWLFLVFLSKTVISPPAGEIDFLLKNLSTFFVAVVMTGLMIHFFSRRVIIFCIPIMVILALTLAVGGCSETVTKHYSTRAEAEADELFERGWLPSLIPLSAKDITISNNVDINISEGEFLYNQKETNEFLRHLKPYSGQKPKLDRWETYITKKKKEGYDSFEYAADGSTWVFLVNTGTGHVRYIMW